MTRFQEWVASLSATLMGSPEVERFSVERHQGDIIVRVDIVPRPERPNGTVSLARARQKRDDLTHLDHIVASLEINGTVHAGDFGEFVARRILLRLGVSQ